MKDKIAEKVMELFGKGVKQNVIAQQLNLSTAKVWRIINKNAPKPEDEEFTDEDYEAYEETVNGAPDDDPASDSPSENPEIPGQPFEDNSDVTDDDSEDHSIEDNSDSPDDDSSSDSPSENPEIPGQPSDSSEQMKAIAEMTSSETARKMTDSYKEILDLLGSVNREIMENSMSGLDKGMRMLLAASERLNAISEKQEKIASCSGNGNRTDLNPEESGNHILYLVLALLLIFTAFCFGGICGTCDLLYLAVFQCGFLLAATVLQLAFYPRSGKHKMLLLFTILGTAAAVTALLAGYFFFQVDKSILHILLLALAGVPVGGIISLLYFLLKRKNEKDSK